MTQGDYYYSMSHNLIQASDAAHVVNGMVTCCFATGQKDVHTEFLSRADKLAPMVCSLVSGPHTDHAYLANHW